MMTIIYRILMGMVPDAIEAMLESIKAARRGDHVTAGRRAEEAARRQMVKINADAKLKRRRFWVVGSEEKKEGEE